MKLDNVKTVGSGSYHQEDVSFLLKDLSSIPLEGNIEEREARIQSEIEHYSESLPIESLPDSSYLETYKKALSLCGPQTAGLVKNVSLKLYQLFQKDMVFISLARAGTPVGILLKRYLSEYMESSIPHYSLSIIRGKGLDLHALQYIKGLHPNKKIIFVDGWTGKGSIHKELLKSCDQFSAMESEFIEPFLAVLCDPADCATVSGTKNDVLIPHACLNATVSGLISRTVLSDQWVKAGEFHGAKFYKEWMEFDESQNYIDTISSFFTSPNDMKNELNQAVPSFKGIKEVEKIATIFSIDNQHLIKPSIGETTRVLLRRVPFKILVRNKVDPQIKHILQLAKEKNVDVMEFPSMSYLSCGIIQPLGDKK